MKWLEVILRFLTEIIGAFKQSTDPEVRRKNKIMDIDSKIDNLIIKRKRLIEELKFENDQEKREKISNSILDYSDDIHRLRVEKEKLQS